jgi:drug/metabolite transporter (DMT)-like permease
MVQQGDQMGGDAENAERILQRVTQDLKTVHQDLIAQLSQDITRLQAEKARLVTDIDRLRDYHPALPQPPVRKLTPAATHLPAELPQREHRESANGLPTATQVGRNGSSESTQPPLSALDPALSLALRSLQQDLASSQSALAQQLNRSSNAEEQGEVLLRALIARLQAQLPMAAGAIAGVPSPPAPPFAKPIPLSLPALPLPLSPEARKEATQFRTGLLLVLLSTLALSLHNVFVRVIGTSSNLLGLFQVGGYIKLGLGNSLLILWLRMLIVLPLMVPVSMLLYPAVWRDIKQFMTDRDRKPLWNVMLSGASLFLSQILIYIAIGQIGPSVAVTILFMYPLVTVPLAWFLFRDRPTVLRWVVMGIISLGIVLTALPSIPKTGVTSAAGVFTAIAAGIAFAFYLIFMQLGFKKLHPVPVSLIQFTTIWLLSSVVLILPLEMMLPPDQQVQVAQPSGFLAGGLLLGILTLVGYLANNFGVRFMGAARASIVASSGPVITALLAFLLIASPLLPVQWLGILLVTAGVTALSFERMRGQIPKAASAVAPTQIKS